MSAEILKRLREKRRVHEFKTEHGTVFYLGLNGKELAEYVKIISDTDPIFPICINQYLIAIAACNEDGTPAFASIEAALEVTKLIDIPLCKQMGDEILCASGLAAVCKLEALQISALVNGTKEAVLQ